MYCCAVPTFHNTQYFKSWVVSFSWMRMFAYVACFIKPCLRITERIKQTLFYCVNERTTQKKYKQSSGQCLFPLIQHIKLPNILLHLVAAYCDLGNSEKETMTIKKTKCFIRDREVIKCGLLW